MRFSVWEGATGVAELFSQWNGIAGNDGTERGESQMVNHMEIMKTDEITSPLL